MQLSAPDVRSMLHSRESGAKVAVVIPAFNEKNIGRTIASIAEAITRASVNVRLVVVNNASTDDTAGIAQYYGANVIDEPRKGVSYARQRGLEEVDVPVHIDTDADTVVPRTWIDTHVAHYGDPKVVGVAGNYTFDHIHPLVHAYRRMIVAAQRSVVRYRQWRGTYRSRRGMSGCNHSYRRDQALAVGYEPGTNQGEDTLMGLALKEKGTVVYDNSPEICVETDGRRFRRPQQILTDMQRLIRRVCRSRGERAIPRGAQFEDIRE